MKFDRMVRGERNSEACTKGRYGIKFPDYSPPAYQYQLQAASRETQELAMLPTVKDNLSAASGSVKRALILVVERNPAVQRLERFFLEQAGLTALARAQELCPKIVVTELLLPHLDGLGRAPIKTRGSVHDRHEHK